MKICSRCKIKKELSCFTKDKQRRDGYYVICKECRHKEYEKHSLTIKEKASNRYYKNKKDGIKPKPSPNKSKNDKKYYLNNRDKIIKYSVNYKKERRNKDIQFRIACNLRRRLHHALKNNYKSGSAVRDLGFVFGNAIKNLKLWLEQQFYFIPEANEWTTWENYGRLWHIDHIIPLSSFDLTDPKQLRKACHWFNLRPLWSKENIAKSDKL